MPSFSNSSNRRPPKRGRPFTEAEKGLFVVFVFP